GVGVRLRGIAADVEWIFEHDEVGPRPVDDRLAELDDDAASLAETQHVERTLARAASLRRPLHDARQSVMSEAGAGAVTDANAGGTSSSETYACASSTHTRPLSLFGDMCW